MTDNNNSCIYYVHKFHSLFNHEIYIYMRYINDSNNEKFYLL